MIGTSAVETSMMVELGPEDAELIRKRLDSGAFAGVEEVIHRAFQTLDADEAWLQENTDIINAKIERGLPSSIARAFPAKSRALDFKKRKPHGTKQLKSPLPAYIVSPEADLDRFTIFTLLVLMVLKGEERPVRAWHLTFEPACSPPRRGLARRG